MIQFENIKKVFGGQTLFEGVSFFVGKGEKCGLVGRNGSGKSTLFRMIMGQEPEDGGNVTFPKHYELGYLDQHITFTQETILDEAALGLPPAEKDHLYKVEAILFGLGFTAEDMDRAPGDFSGGYQLRLHLAKVLVSEPDCLLLDEPTNYLDIVSIRWLERFLRNWRREFILITHDREFMDRVTTHTLGIHRNRVRKVKGGTEEFFTQILLEEEVHEKTRQKMDQKRQKLQGFVDRFGAKATKAGQAQSKLKSIQKMPTLEKLAMIDDLDFTFNPAFFPGKQMLQAEDVSFSYTPDSDQDLISQLCLSIEKNECIAIVGKNGRGKSTILKLLTEELTAKKGRIKCSPNLKVGYFGQTNIDRLASGNTIEEEIQLSNSLLSVSEVRGVCGVMMFDGDKAKKTISVLSGGERSRVLLGKIIASPCNILFLDEPTHHLDMESIESLITAIENFPGAVIIVTHSEMILKKLPLTKVVVCRIEGQEVVTGDYQDFLDRGGWEQEGSKKGKAKRKKFSKQEIKQRTAEIVQERSKVLRPLQKEAEKKEKQIMELEKLVDERNHLLIEASQTEKSMEISKLSKEISESQKQIEKLFEELEQVSAEIVEKSASFDSQLKEFE